MKYKIKHPTSCRTYFVPHRSLVKVFNKQQAVTESDVQPEVIAQWLKNHGSWELVSRLAVKVKNPSKMELELLLNELQLGSTAHMEDVTYRKRKKREKSY